MKKIVLVACLALTLSGCATMGTLTTAVTEICGRQDSIRAAMDLALSQSLVLSDPAKHEMLEKVIAITEQGLDRCPQ